MHRFVALATTLGSAESATIHTLRCNLHTLWLLRSISLSHHRRGRPRCLAAQCSHGPTLVALACDTIRDDHLASRNRLCLAGRPASQPARLRSSSALRRIARRSVQRRLTQRFAGQTLWQSRGCCCAAQRRSTAYACRRAFQRASLWFAQRRP